MCRRFDQQYSRIHAHVIVVKNGGCNTSHSKQKLRVSTLLPILLKYQRKICQPSGVSNSRKLKNSPPSAEIKWFGEKCGQFYLQQYLLSINDFIKVLLLKAIVKCTTMCVTFCIYVTGHSTHRKESTLTNTHRSQNVWHIHLEKCKKKLLISTLTSDQNVRPNSQT